MRIRPHLLGWAFCFSNLKQSGPRLLPNVQRTLMAITVCWFCAVTKRLRAHFHFHKITHSRNHLRFNFVHFMKLACALLFLQLVQFTNCAIGDSKDILLLRTPRTKSTGRQWFGIVISRQTRAQANECEERNHD